MRTQRQEGHECSWPCLCVVVLFTCYNYRHVIDRAPCYSNTPLPFTNRFPDCTVSFYLRVLPILFYLHGYTQAILHIFSSAKLKFLLNEYSSFKYMYHLRCLCTCAVLTCLPKRLAYYACTVATNADVKLAVPYSKARQQSFGIGFLAFVLLEYVSSFGSIFLQPCFQLANMCMHSGHGCRCQALHTPCETCCACR